MTSNDNINNRKKHRTNKHQTITSFFLHDLDQQLAVQTLKLFYGVLLYVAFLLEDQEYIYYEG